jgi:hypothetical protein
MKQFYLALFFSLLCFYKVDAQTYAGIPGPENVLVVWTDTTRSASDSIKEYYKNERGIPL